MITKIVSHMRRVWNARRYGVSFLRRASFKLPTKIQILAKPTAVSSPDELGAKNDFLTCFLDDDYGLAGVHFPVRTIADIGANIGFFSMAARSYFPNATIHAYEPNPRVFPHVSKNASAAGITLFPEAVGSVPGYVFMEDSGESNQARTSVTEESGTQVPQITLETIVNRLGGSIDLAKIDCEGAEWEIFKSRSAWTKIKHVRMEYHLWGKHSYSELEVTLRRIGFEVHRHMPAGEWGIVWARNSGKFTSQ
jgi:FkbM family methyltransferase